jgi:hypothetical protein
MAKKVARSARIEIRESTEHEWVDISDHVTGWDWIVRAGALYVLKLHLTYDPAEHDLNNKKVTISSVRISDYLQAYQFDASDHLTLDLYCDADRLRINGTAPWEEPR